MTDETLLAICAEVRLSSRRRKKLHEEAAGRVQAKRTQAIRDAGGMLPKDLDAELKQIEHERLVHSDEELRAFRAEEVEFFGSHFGRHFRDGITELPSDVETRGFPALIRVKAYRSQWEIFDMESKNELVVDYRIEYPDGFVPKLVDMSAHEAALRAYDGELRANGFNDLENLAFNLIAFCLKRNLTGFATLAQNEMQRRLPSVSAAEIQAAYTRANERWVEVYCP